MFNLFKLIQGIKKGTMNNVGWGSDKEKRSHMGKMGTLNFGTDFANLGIGKGFGGW